MKSTLAGLVEKLKSVHWTTNPASSILLTKHKIEHGFLRQPAEKTLQSIAPHHVKQVHGVEFTQASNLTLFTSNERPEADGIFSTDAETVAIKTADCLPVLIASTNGNFVAAVHAGWRGLTSGILLNALRTAHTSQAINTLRVIIGPSISRERFEVGPEVVEALQSYDCGLKDDSWGLAVSKGLGDRWHVDLSVAATSQMLLAGIEPGHIEVIQSCTVTSKRDGEFIWSSYRRDGKACGSNWTWIRGK